MGDEGIVYVTMTTTDEHDKRLANSEDFKFLEKKVQNVQNMSFGKLTELILNPSADSLNSAEYNADQRELAAFISGNKQKAYENRNSDKPDIFDEHYVQPDGSLSSPVQLTDIVKNCPGIISEKTKKDGFGTELKYNALDLVSYYKAGGGNR